MNLGAPWLLPLIFMSAANGVYLWCLYLTQDGVAAAGASMVAVAGMLGVGFVIKARAVGRGGGRGCQAT